MAKDTSLAQGTFLTMMHLCSGALRDVPFGLVCSAPHSELILSLEGSGDLEEPQSLPMLCTVQGTESVLDQLETDASFSGHMHLPLPSLLLLLFSHKVMFNSFTTINMY